MPKDNVSQMDTFIQHGGVSSNLPIQTVTDTF